MFVRKEPAPDRNDRYGSAPLPHFTERDRGRDRQGREREIGGEIDKGEKEIGGEIGKGEREIQIGGEIERE